MLLATLCLAAMPTSQEPVFVRTRDENGNVIVIQRDTSGRGIELHGLERLPLDLPVRVLVEDPDGRGRGQLLRRRPDEPVEIARPWMGEQVSLLLGDLEPHRILLGPEPARWVDLELDPDRWQRCRLELAFDRSGASADEAMVHWVTEDGDSGPARLEVRDGLLRLWLTEPARYTIQVLCSGHLPSDMIRLQDAGDHTLRFEPAAEQRIELVDGERRLVTTGRARLRPLEVEGLLLNDVVWEGAVLSRGLSINGLPPGLYEIEVARSGATRHGIVELESRPTNHHVRLLSDE